LQQSVFEINNKNKEELENLKTKHFILENVLSKKINIIENLKMKIEKLEDFPEIFREKEYYILEPNKALLYFSNEISSFKDLYSSALQNLCELQKKFERKKNKITVIS